ncbi:MAG: signal peptidase II [Desulfotalea sp.]|nr:MAG: signal peptidase II [Desulfotalea sp.]
MAYLLLITAVIVTDQISKFWIVDTLHLYESREIIPGLFNLVYVVNPGAAFSILADVDSPWRHYFFLIVGCLAIVGMTVAYIKLRTENDRYYLPLGLIVGGAIGNMIDRIRFGSVIDFLDFYMGNYHWPAFNVADSAICVGAVLFIGMNFCIQKKIETEEKI